MNKIFSKKKLIFFPSIIILAAILFAGIISYNISKQRLMDQLKQDGFNYAKLLAQKIELLAEITHEEVDRLTEKNNLQIIVEKTTAEHNILYALILDNNLVAIADSDIAEIGVIYEDDQEYIAALQGQASAVQWHYDRIGRDVVEVATPIYFKEEIVGVVAIGLSMDNVYDSLLLTGLVFGTVGGIVFLAFWWSQTVNIIKPIIRLEKQIQELEINSSYKRKLSYTSDDTFEGLYITINNLLEKTYSEIKLNKNLSYTIEHQAYHDYLTGLPNRLVFLNNIEDSFSTGQTGAVLMVDLDNFKDINYTFGHSYGDEVLRNIANVLRKFVNNNTSIYRFGGDEFLILLRPVSDIQAVSQLAEAILREFENRLTMGGAVFVNIVVANCPKNIISRKTNIGIVGITIYQTPARTISGGCAPRG